MTQYNRWRTSDISWMNKMLDVDKDVFTNKVETKLMKEVALEVHSEQNSYR